MDRPKALICDIDGVLIDSSVRHAKYLGHFGKDTLDFNKWRGFVESLHAYNTGTAGDEIIEAGVSLLKWAYDEFSPDRVFFVTARMERGRKPTFLQLQEIWPSVADEDLLMMPSAILTASGRWSIPPEMMGPWVEGALGAVPHKRRVLDGLISEFDITMAIDDHPEVCELYMSRGIQVLRPMWADQGLWRSPISKEEQ